MSSDKTNSQSNLDAHEQTMSTNRTGSAGAEKKHKSTLDDKSLREEKYKQDQLRFEKLKQETLRQEALRQEFENEELQRQEELKQAKLKEEQLKQAELEQQEQERLRVEKEYQAQLKLEEQRQAQEKIEKEHLRQKQLMSQRLEKERIERELSQQQVSEAVTPSFSQEQATEDSQELSQELPEEFQAEIFSDTEKPAKSAIFGFANKIRSTFNNNEKTSPDAESFEAVINTNFEQRQVQASPTPAKPQTISKARNFQLCGNIDHQSYIENNEQIRFNPEDYLLSSMLHYIDQSKRSLEVIRLTFDRVVIVIDYSLNTIYCNMPLTSHEFDKQFREPSNPAIDVYALEFDEIRTERRNSAKLGNSIEAFIWTCTMLTAKGRLPSHTDISRKISVKSDANFDRLEKIPYLEQLNSALQSESIALGEISDYLNVPQKYVFSFYNAAHNLYLLEYNVENKSVNSSKSISGFFKR